MSAKTKRLTKLLFRRSSSVDEPKRLTHGEISYDHQNISYYRTLMTFNEAAVASPSRSRDTQKVRNDIEKTTPLIPIANPHLIEGSRFGHVPATFGRVFVFLDNPYKKYYRHNRTRSSSPIRIPPTKITSTSAPSAPDPRCMNLNDWNMRKSTLLRTQSTPNSLSKKLSKSIPVPIPTPPTRHEKNKQDPQSNPLLHVSWNYPTMEKKKDAILKYFKNLNKKDEQAQADPIYEEVPDKHKEEQRSDSLKPKLSPKKVRLNLQPSYRIDDEEENLYKIPVRKGDTLTRSISFSSVSHFMAEGSSKNPAPVHNESCKDTNNSSPTLSTFKFTTSHSSKNLHQTPEGDNKLPAGTGVNLAKFASEVANHAVANRYRRKCSRSISFSDYGTIGHANSFEKNNNHHLSGGVINRAGENSCPMDEIYFRLDKRGKKAGTPTTRLLKRHQTLEKENPCEDFYINITPKTLQAIDYAYKNDGTEEEGHCSSQFSEKMNKGSPAMSTNNLYANIITKTESELADMQKSVLKQMNNGNHSSQEFNNVKKRVINQGIKNAESLKSEESEGESGVSVDSACDEGDDRMRPRRIPSTSADSCYSWSSTNSSSEEESESQVGVYPQPLAKQVRSTQHLHQVEPQQRQQDRRGSTTATQSQIPDVDNFVTFVKVESEEETLSNVHKDKKDRDNIGVDFDPVPATGSCQTVLTINVIDSTQSTPTSYLYPASGIRSSEYLRDWYRSLRKGEVRSDQGRVVVIHQIPKSRNSATCCSKSLVTRSGTDYHAGSETNADKLDGEVCGKFCGNQINFEDLDKRRYPEKEIKETLADSGKEEIMSSAVMAQTAQLQDDKLSASSGLLIETQNLWDPSSPTSPKSQSSEAELSSTSSNSDISEISVQLATMTESESRNPFNRQDSKYYDDMDEDGGFESFQVLGGDEAEERYDDEASQSDDNEGQFLGISESTAHRQRTFAQVTQNVPEGELQKKATTVLDLINAEISDLHMREMELKKKNRVADGKQEYDNDSEDLVEMEGSSQADSEEYSDSAVDVESYSRTSNSSGNVTPADRDKNQEDNERAQSESPDRRPEVEGEVKEEEGAESGQLDGLTSSTSSSLAVGEDSPSSGTNKQQSIKVRPIVEEEVKSIELSLERETPIEREIRLVREREEEFRRQRSLKSLSSVESNEPPSSPSVEAKSVQETSPKVLAAETPKTTTSVVANAKAIFGSGGGTSPKDLQYEMATARLKREIEENLMREKELFNEGRLKSAPTIPPKDETVVEKVEEGSGTATPADSEESDMVDNVFQEVKETKKEAERPVEKKAAVRLPSAPAAPVTEEKTPLEPKFQTSAAPPLSAPPTNSMRFFTPSGFSSPQSLNYQKSPSFSSMGPSSMAFSKPQFTSIERMILKGSFAFNKTTLIPEEPQRMEEEARLAKIAMMPDPLQIVQRPESNDETDGDEERAEGKPLRKKYIPATDKIQLELQEQMKREKELSQIRARWKSTPDLSKSEDNEEETDNGTKEEPLVKDEELTKPSALRRQISASTQRLSIDQDVTTTDVLRMNKPTVRRRQSALINQWEEMIKQQQQKNNKN